MRTSSVRLFTLIAVLAATVGLARADVYTWNLAGNSTWATAGNWDPVTGPPGAADTAVFDDTTGAGRTVTIATDAADTVNVNGTYDWTWSGGTSLTIGAGGLNHASSGTSSLSAKMLGTGGLTVTAGILNVNNTANGFSGQTLIDGGAIRMVGGGTQTGLGSGLLRLKSGNLSGQGGSNYYKLTNNWQLEGDFTFGKALATDTVFAQMSGTGTLLGSYVITVDNASQEMQGVIGDGGSGYGFTKMGVGTLILTKANTFSGQVAIKEGTVQFTSGSTTVGSDNPLGTNGTILLGDSVVGADVALYKGNGSGALWQDITIAAGAGSRSLGTNYSNGNGTFSGTITLNKDAAFRGYGNAATFSGKITGTGNITKVGTAAVAFTGTTANDYVGDVFLTEGTLQLGKTAGLNAISGNVKVGDYIGAAVNRDVLQLTANDQIPDSLVVPITATGQLDLNSKSETVTSIRGSGNINTGTGTLTFGSDNAAVSLPGSITGTTGNVQYVGTGGLTLTGDSSAYTGSITVDAATLRLAPAAAPSANVALGDNAAAVLDLDNQNVAVGSLEGGGGSGGSVTMGSKTLTINGANTAAKTFAGTISGTGGLVKAGAGTQSLVGATLSYSGQTQITGGALRLAALPGSSNVQMAGGAVEMAGDFAVTLGTGAGQVDLGGAGGGGFAGYSADRTVNIGGAGATLVWGSTAQFLADGQPLLFSSPTADKYVDIQNPIDLNAATRTVYALQNTSSGGDLGILSGALSNGGLVKDGTGYVRLTAVNPYGGTTTVAGGRLQLYDGGRLTGTSGVAILGSMREYSTGPGLYDNSFNTLMLDNTGTDETDRLPDAAGITITGLQAGAVLSFIGKAATASSETVGAVTVNNGLGIVSAAIGAGGSAELTLGSLTLTNQAIVNFAGTSLGAAGNAPRIKIATQLADSSFLGAGYLYNAGDFAAYDYSGGAGTGVIAVASNTGGETTWDNTHAKTAAAATLTGDRSPYSLALSSSTARTIALNENNLNVQYGGLLFDSGGGTAANHTLSGAGRLTAGGTAAGDLVVIVGTVGTSSGYWRTATVSSNITDNAGADSTYGNGDDGAVRLVKSGPGTLNVTGTNTFTGGTVVAEGRVLAGNATTVGTAAYGAGPITVRNGASLGFYSQTSQGTLAWSNAITADDGATIGTTGANGASGGAVNLTGGITTSSGTVTLAPGTTAMRIGAAITGNAGVQFAGTALNSYQTSSQTYLDVANSYHGPTTFTAGGYVVVNNANGFGTDAETIVVNAPPTAVAGARASVQANVDIHNAKKFEIGAYGNLVLAAGVTFDNDMTWSGGNITFVGTGATRSLQSNVTLTAGTITYFEMTGISAGQATTQEVGVISGDGALRFKGVDGNTTTTYIHGGNSYAGGTELTTGASNAGGKLYINNGSALGSGPIYLNNSAGANDLLRIENSLTLANTIRGAGTINTINTSRILTLTGDVQPGDIGLAAGRIAAIGTLDLTMLDFRGDYAWDFDETNGVIYSDLISASLGLTLNNAPHVLTVNWLGDGAAPLGTYTLMTYAGGDPELGDWSVLAPAGRAGTVSLDADNNKVLLTLDVPEPATIGLLVLGFLPLAFRRKRCR